MARKLLVVGLALWGSLALAQSAPSAEGNSGSVWAGAEFSMFNPDWGCKSSSPFSCGKHQLQGVAVFADANRLLGPVGVEGQARWLPWHGPTIKQANYLVGPRFQVLDTHRFSGNVKFLAGAALFYPQNKPWQGWAAFVPGATLGYRLSSRLILRGDYEYQMWPGFRGRRGAHGLTPNGFSVGVSYRILP